MPIFLLLVFFLSSFTRGSERVYFNILESLELSYEDFIGGRNGQIILADIEETDSNSGFLQNCHQSLSTFKIEKEDELEFKDSEEISKRLVVSSKNKLFILEEPDHFLSYGIKTSSNDSLFLDFEFFFKEKGDMEDFFKASSHIIFNEGSQELIGFSSDSFFFFGLSLSQSVSLRRQYYPEAFPQNEKLVSALLKDDELLVTFQKTGIFVFNYEGNGQMTQTALMGPSFFNQNEIYMEDIAVHPKLKRILVAESFKGRAHMIKKAENGQFVLTPSPISSSEISRVLVSMSSIFVIGYNSHSNRTIISEYHAPFIEESSTGTWNNLSEFSHERDFSTHSIPVGYEIDNSLFYIVAQNLVQMIRHSVPMAYVGDSTKLVAWQQWEDIHSIQISKFEGNSITIITQDLLILGTIVHSDPSLHCELPLVQTGSQEGETITPQSFIVPVNLVAMNCSSHEEIQFVCSNRVEFLVEEYMPILKNTNIAFFLGAFIGIFIVCLLAILYLYSYCRLQKDYDLLKEDLNYSKSEREKQERLHGDQRAMEIVRLRETEEENS